MKDGDFVIIQYATMFGVWLCTRCGVVVGPTQTLPGDIQGRTALELHDEFHNQLQPSTKEHTP